MGEKTKKKIAIIGGGIAGLTAAYLLNSKYDITLFEKEDRLGGNAYTHRTGTGETLDIAVGSVVKSVGARNFLALCDEVHVKMIRQPANSYVSLHDLETNAGLYVTPFSLSGLWTQRFRLYRSFEMAGILMQVYRVTRLLNDGKLHGLSVEESLRLLPGLKRIEKLFITGFLCVVSCMYYEEVMRGPAEYFIGKLKAFDLLNPVSVAFGNYFPKNFTQSYVDALSAAYREKTVLHSKILGVLRSDKNVKVRTEDGKESIFDTVVFACNADQALALIENPTEDEQKLLGAWKYKDVPMVIHRDAAYAPHRSLCQPWTAIQSAREGHPHFFVSYCCWLLCPAASNKSPYFSTQHSNFPIREDRVDAQKTFRVPLVDFDSFATIDRLPTLNGRMRSYFCGSHFGYCLHGHAVDSAIDVARQLGIDCDRFD